MLDELVERLCWRVSAVLAAPGNTSLDAARSLLIEAGEAEQAAEDCLPTDTLDAASIMECLRELAISAGALFYAVWSRSSSRAPAGRASSPARHRERLSNLLSRLRAIHIPSGTWVTVNVPEGYAFYALYPEQYCVAAERWLTDHPDARRGRTLVVGIRSIGTSLSAVTAGTLAAAGCDAARLTARPLGQPFERHVELPLESSRGIGWALVVDEGPGLSGSSMAAVAEALAHAGVKRERISFLPGHANDPGGAASPGVRDWWQTTRRYTTSWTDPCWNGGSLPEALAAAASDLLSEPVAKIEDTGETLSRLMASLHPNHRSPICLTFERPRFRCITGTGRALLWSFAGLASAPGCGGTMVERMLAILTQRAAAGWTPPPLGDVYGFVAQPWAQGAPLTRADLSPSVLAALGRYVAAAAGPPLSRDEHMGALQRLREMLYWNTWESLGEAAAARAARFADRALRRLGDWSGSSYGDGRMAPQEWLRTPDGQLLKIDAAGRTMDHTIVGRQSITWDVAGALVEWQVPDDDADPLLDAMEKRSAALSRGALRFYRMAYAAFRLGQCALSAGRCGAAAEAACLQRTTDAYRRELAVVLQHPPGAVPRLPAAVPSRRGTLHRKSAPVAGRDYR